MVQVTTILDFSYLRYTGRIVPHSLEVRLQLMKYEQKWVCSNQARGLTALDLKPFLAAATREVTVRKERSQSNHGDNLHISINKPLFL